MIYNILNGDALAYSFPDTKIEGDVIVVREGLIDGDLSGDNLQDFWQSRAKGYLPSSKPASIFLAFRARCPAF